MNSIQGPAIFLAQFVRDEEPYNQIDLLAEWASGLGFKGVQIPGWEPRCIDLDKVAESKQYADEYRENLNDKGVSVTEVTAHLAGQVIAMHPAYEKLFQAFYPEGFNDRERLAWATGELKKTIKASVNLGTQVVPVLSGGFAWHTVYPWPQRPPGLIDEAFKELANRWKPILNFAAENGISIAFELHPGSDLFDGLTFERFLREVDHHPAATINYDPSHFLLQQLDYLGFIRNYGDRITGFHVKDAEFRPDGRVGVYGGFADWSERAGRFRSLGDGQVDFKQVFTLLTEAGYRGWSVLEWECCVKSPEQGAREGAPFIQNHIIEATSIDFDDFAGSKTESKLNREILGISSRV